MRLRYHREKILGGVRCLCDSDHVNAHGVSLLACLLMDDGGLGRDTTIKWLEEGMLMVGAVSSGTRSDFSWDREDWGAEIRADGVTIYSHHDESWSEVMSLASFGRALSSWREFLLADDSSLEEGREIIL